MNAEIFRKTLEFSREFKKNLEGFKSSQPNYPTNPQELLERSKLFIQALYRGEKKLEK